MNDETKFTSPDFTKLNYDEGSGIDARKLERRENQPTYFGGMKYFNHPLYGARPNRRLPGVNNWEKINESKGDN